MQTEIRLRPPYQISLSELGSPNGLPEISLKEYKGTGKMSAGEFVVRSRRSPWKVEKLGFSLTFLETVAFTRPHATFL